jgi:hypothetical protein
LLGGGLTARAQETTSPVTPDPAECTVTSLTLDGFYAVVGTPVSGTPMAGTEGEGTGDTEASPTPFTLPTGTPADEATRAAVTDTIRMILACFNAGNYLAYFALVTDTALLANIAEVPLTLEDVSFLQGTPQAADSATWSTLVAVRDVIVLDDGRVGALIDTIFPDEETACGSSTIVEDLEGQFPAESMGTPVAAYVYVDA